MNSIATKAQNGTEPVRLHPRIRTSPPMKTSAQKKKFRESASGAPPQIRLKIHYWPSMRFIQPILIRPRRQPEHDFREAHSADVCPAGCAQRTGRETVRFPTDLAREKN